MATFHQFFCHLMLDVMITWKKLRQVYKIFWSLQNYLVFKLISKTQILLNEGLLALKSAW